MCDERDTGASLSVADRLSARTGNQHGGTDIDFLSTIKSKSGEPLFEDGFLTYLADLKFTCDVDAIPEGSVVFPHEPIVRVIGPVLQCQIIETPLLNIINFQTLVATKASRIAYAAKGESVLEFGLRRAQGVDGAIAASRAAYIGGCSSTSNVLAAKLFDIPVAGTHAHSWILTFDSELEAFQAYADALPDNCVFLVDTYDTLEGVKNAAKVGKVLRDKGKEMIGIRIDSGDLAYFSQQARKILDEEGFENAQIIASNDLNERLIQSLKMQDAKISVWGIGTKLVTAYDQPALGAVYKLSAIRNNRGEWEYKQHTWDDAPDYIAQDLYGAVRWILKQEQWQKSQNEQRKEKENGRKKCCRAHQ